MIVIPKYFSLHELVCDHIYMKYGHQAFTFLDPRQVILMDWLREAINKPVYVNNYKWKGNQTQSGVRCNLCQLVKDKTDNNEVYMSAHIQGQADDFSVKGMTADQVRNWLIKHKDKIPYNIRLEAYVKWVHMDCRDCGEKIFWF